MTGRVLLIAAHAAAATFAVVVGLLLLRARRKGDRFHRRLGTVWMATMYFVVLSSFGIRELRPGHWSWIHGLSLWTFLTLTIALWAARTRRREVHRGFVVGSYFGLVGAGLAAVAFPVRALPQLIAHRPLVAVGSLALVVAAAVLVARLVRARTQPAGFPAPVVKDVAHVAAGQTVDDRACGRPARAAVGVGGG